MEIDDVVGAAFLPTDGQANPSDITMALARGARMHGATICEDTEVLRIEVEAGVIKAVVTVAPDGSEGRIECEKVVVCGGQWTRALCATVGVNVPLVPVEHQYAVSYTHLRAHETVLDLVCRLLLEKKNKRTKE